MDASLKGIQPILEIELGSTRLVLVGFFYSQCTVYFLNLGGNFVEELEESGCAQIHHLLQLTAYVGSLCAVMVNVFFELQDTVVYYACIGITLRD